MKYIKVGTIVNTHALKGEVRIISNFEYKDKVFKINNTLYIGMSKSEEVIETYRVHKNFDMVKFKGIDNITDVLKYKGSAVYVNIDDLKLKDDEILILQTCSTHKDYHNYQKKYLLIILRRV